MRACYSSDQSQALTTISRFRASGVSVAAGISDISWSATCQCLPALHALMAALKLNMSAGNRNVGMPGMYFQGPPNF